MIRSLLLIHAVLSLSPAFAQLSNLAFVDNLYNISTEHAKLTRLKNIKLEEVYDYNLKRKGIRDSTLIAQFKYDSTGHLVEKMLTNTQLMSIGIIKYVYELDPAGRLTRVTANNETMKVTTIYEFEYDSSGREEFSYQWNKDRTRGIIHKNFYNEKGLLIGQIMQKDDEDPYTVSKLYYDEDGDLIREESLEKDGKIKTATIYVHEKQLRKTSVYIENIKGKKLREHRFFDEDGKLTKLQDIFITTTIYDDNRSTDTEQDRVIEFTYHQNGLPFEMTTFLNGKKSHMVRHHYK
jgi:hypothetical protein